MGRKRKQNEQKKKEIEEEMCFVKTLRLGKLFL